MNFSSIEYFTLRVIRKFLFTTQLLVKIGKYIPYYKTNVGFTEPERIADLYLKYCTIQNISIEGKNILEVGTGAINSIAYVICNKFLVGKYYSFEPYIKFDAVKDNEFHLQAKAKYNKSLDGIHQRIEELKLIKEKSIDIIFSYSVLEHVNEMDELIAELKKCLKLGGAMIHIVDYRDHFFKYPYHFLLYSKKTWDRYLNPCDLPRWRISDHIKEFEKQGFKVLILSQVFDDEEYQKVEKRIHAEFSEYQINDLKTISGVLFVQ